MLADWQPFFLNHNTPSEGEDMYEHLADKYGEQKARIFTSPNNPLDKAGAKCGVTFNAARRIIRTADSHRLVEWCKEVAPSKEDALMEKLFEAYFTHAKDLSKHSELAACAAACGLDSSAATTMLAGELFEQVVQQKAKGWSRQGVSGVPYFVINTASGKGKAVAFSGAQPSELIAQVLSEQAEL